MKFSSNLYPVAVVSICIISLILSCTMGGSAEQGNARVFGAVSGTPLVSVQLVTEKFNPFDNMSGNVFTTQTNCLGHYEFDSVPFGSYYLYAFDGGHKQVLLEGPFIITSDQRNFGYSNLQKASVVTIVDNDSIDDSLALYFIKGASTAKPVRNGASPIVELLEAPAGIHDIMK